MLNKLSCTFGVSFSRFHYCGRHGIGPYLRPRPCLPHRTHNVSTVLHVVRFYQFSMCTVAFADHQLVVGRASDLARHPPALQTGASARPRARRPRARRVRQRHAGSGATPTETTSSLTRVGRRWWITVVLTLTGQVLKHAQTSTT